MKRFLRLIRALFPNWNFFDQIAHTFEIEYQPPGSQNWQKLSFDDKRTWPSLFFNPDHNLALAEINVIEHYAQNLQDEVSFLLVQAIIKNRLPHLEKKTNFKLVAVRLEKKIDLHTWMMP